MLCIMEEGLATGKGQSSRRTLFKRLLNHGEVGFPTEGIKSGIIQASWKLSIGDLADADFLMFTELRAN